MTGVVEDMADEVVLVERKPSYLFRVRQFMGISKYLIESQTVLFIPVSRSVPSEWRVHLMSGREEGDCKDYSLLFNFLDASLRSGTAAVGRTREETRI